MNESLITEIAKLNGAIAIIGGKEVWADASGSMVKKLMLAAANQQAAKIAKLEGDKK